MARPKVEIDAPAVPGIRAGLTALTVATVPLLWLAVYVLSAGLVGAQQMRTVMLAVEPFVFVFSLAIAGLFIPYALVRNRKAGKVLGTLALVLTVFQIVAVLIVVVPLLPRQ